MKIKINTFAASGFMLLTICLLCPIQVYAAAGEDELRIHTGDPKKNGESIVSVSSRWKTDAGLITGSTSLIIINGSDRSNPDNGLSIAQKTSKAMEVSMIDHHPKMRGLDISVSEKADDPQIVVKNNDGHVFTQLTFRDYSNQQFSAELGGQSFSSKGVHVSIDLVDASEVDYVDAFNPQKNVKKSFRAAGGGIEIRAGVGKKLEAIKTSNRTLAEIEQAIATKLGGRFSKSPLYADEKERDKRNIKAFDGGEAQFASLTDKIFTIAVNDPSLGVITRYRFANAVTSSGGSTGSNFPLIVILVLLAAGGFYMYSRNSGEADS